MNKFILITVLFCVPTFSQANLYYLTLFNQSKLEDKPVIKMEDKENPFSKGLGQRIAGGVLTGSGAINLLSYVLFDISVESKAFYEKSPHEVGGDLKNFILMLGLIKFSIGLPLFISGSTKYDNWKAWENKNGRVSYDPKSGDLVISI